jgi:uncharacterized protein HemY
MRDVRCRGPFRARTFVFEFPIRQENSCLNFLSAAVLDRRWDERLLDEYASCELPDSRATIERAESWLKEHPRSQSLLQCLARICLRQKLWGKARAYLDECQRLGEDAQTSLALAQLAEAIGDVNGARQHFREAALGLARRQAEEALHRLRAVRREPTW